MLKGLSSFLRLPSRSRGSRASRGSSVVSPRREPAGAGGSRQKDAGEVTDTESTGSLSTDTERSSLQQGSMPWQLEARRQEEKDFIRQHDTADASTWYLVDVRWLQDWKHFVTRGGPVPGPIDNSRLVDARGEPCLGLQAVHDYRGVNQAIWAYWHGRYGGGPSLRRKQLDLHAPAVEEPEPSGAGARPDVSLPGAAQPAAPHAAPAPARAGSRRAVPRETQPPATLQREEAPTEVQATGQRRSAASGGSALSRAASAMRRSTPTPTEAPAASPSASSKASPCCDKCDGPHETSRCPHFKQARERHQDAWTSYGKSKSFKESSADGSPIVRNAKVVPQPADGSCLFHSLSYGLSDRTNATTLRRDICGYIAKNPDMKIADTAIKDWIKYDSDDESVQSYAQRMANGTWGGGIEMAALTHMRGVNVHVYEKCDEGYQRISAFDSPHARKTINVLYQGRMHYDAMVV